MEYRIIFGFVYLILLLCLFGKAYNRTKDLFSPICFFSLFQILKYFPGILFIEEHLYISITEYDAIKVFFYQLIVTLSMLCGYSLTNRNLHSYKLLPEFKYKRNKFYGVLIFSVGFVFGLIYLQMCGGLNFILGSIYNPEYTKSKSYMLLLLNVMTFGVSLILYKNRSKVWTVIVLILFSILAGFYVVFTRRSPVLEIILILLFVYNYSIKRWKLSNIFNVKSIAFVIIIFSFLVLMPAIRKTGSFENIQLNQVVEVVRENADSFFKQFSYTSRDAFVYNNYNFSNYYYGRSFINILTAPIPSSMFVDKPPVDDGMYLCNFVNGFYVLPPSNKVVVKNSYPFSTQGSMFANFGILGLIVGWIFIGYIYAKIYNKLKASNFDLVYILFYQQIVYHLELTSLNIVQFFSYSILLYLVFRIFYRWKISFFNYRRSL